MASDDESATCTICLGELLTEDDKGVCALECGHAFHLECIVLYIELRDKTCIDCPQCRRVCPQTSIRNLYFDVTHVPSRMLEDLHHLESESAEQRSELQASLRDELTTMETAFEVAGQELAELQEGVQACKRARKDAEQRGQAAEAKASELAESILHAREQSAELQAHLDVQSERLLRKLPVSRPRTGDEDLNNERQKLKVLKPVDRAKQLHAAYASARQQEQDCVVQLNQRQQALEEAEAELRRLQKEEAKLRRDLSERRDEAESQLSPPDAIERREAEERRGVAAAAQGGRPVVTHPEVNVEVLGSGLWSAPTVKDQADDDMALLYGSGASRKALGASGNLLGQRPQRSSSSELGAKNGAAVAKFGALFKERPGATVPGAAASDLFSCGTAGRATATPAASFLRAATAPMRGKAQLQSLFKSQA
eukprot:gnl/TRDRNA2_/TRDRNA2_37997_c0_seq1.p1 gnl/TRDRNA2_/TRDRNA2_37997_c0~~gnl/TRDRNA2_/TRDRNA2_37997_c0_seq1.p1  ORF type:complete len:478 (-),score=100.36 gnl/TRDRNA2_/TRDRNA2_37997_c0_seq1:83-1360(-)